MPRLGPHNGKRAVQKPLYWVIERHNFPSIYSKLCFAHNRRLGAYLGFVLCGGVRCTSVCHSQFGCRECSRTRADSVRRLLLEPMWLCGAGFCNVHDLPTNLSTEHPNAQRSSNSANYSLFRFDIVLGGCAPMCCSEYCRRGTDDYKQIVWHVFVGRVTASQQVGDRISLIHVAERTVLWQVCLVCFYIGRKSTYLGVHCIPNCDPVPIIERYVLSVVTQLPGWWTIDKYNIIHYLGKIIVFFVNILDQSVITNSV